MAVYYAHPVTDYGTEFEAGAVETLADRFGEVVNPNGPDHAAAYASQRMGYFQELAAGCDALAFSRFPDESVGAGVAKEIVAASEAGRRVWEYTRNGDVMPSGPDAAGGALSVEETRATIARLRAA